MTLLSILDYGIRDEGQTSEEALAQTVERARLAEHLGYHRFWVAEHHNVPAFTSSAPEMLMMHLLNPNNTDSYWVGWHYVTTLQPAESS